MEYGIMELARKSSTEVGKIVFHSILEIYHSGIFHTKIFVLFHTMPCI